MIKINTSGDYVQLIYVDPVQESVQQELKSDTDAFECSYDSDGKLFMQFGAMRFENPDPTDFTINDVAITDAADFISKLNALFTGGGGGGATIYTADGSLSGDRIVNLNGHQLSFNGINGSNNRIDFILTYPEIQLTSSNNSGAGLAQLLLFGSAGEELAGLVVQSSESATQSRIVVYADSDNGYAFYLTADNAAHRVEIEGNAIDNSLAYTADTHTFNGAIITPNVIALDFADDAAAAIGGVAVGQLYHNAGAVRIRRS